MKLIVNKRPHPLAYQFYKYKNQQIYVKTYKTHSNKHNNIYNKPNSAFVARFFGETLSLRSKVNNRNAKTIFGPIKITDNKIKKTKEIEIIFRSEAFNVTKNNAKKNPRKIKSKIIAVKYISENSYLHLDILSNSVQKHIHIKVSGKFIPPKNKICYINIGKKNFFIFKYK